MNVFTYKKGIKMEQLEVKKRIIQKFREAALNPKDRLHIFPSRGKWLIKKEGEFITSKLIPSQELAIEKALKDYKEKEIILHSIDGSIKKIR